MILVVCVDKDNGMMFFQRRQSRDRLLIGRLLETKGAAPLWVSPYTAGLFDETEGLSISPEPQKRAGKGEFYFAEDCPLPEEMPEAILLYRYETQYPATVHFPLAQYLPHLPLREKTQFVGSSHPVIVEERYGKDFS